MPITAGTFRMGLKTLTGDLDAMAVRVVREGPGRSLEIQPRSPTEPRWRTFHAKFKYRDRDVSGGTIAFPSDFVVTATRLLMIVSRNRDKKGVENFVVATANRADFPDLRVIPDRKGAAKSVELHGADGSASILVSFVSDGFPDLLDWLGPSSVTRLDEAAARVHREEVRVAEAQRAEAERHAQEGSLQAAKARFRAAHAADSARSSISLTAGSVFDHRKTYHYEVAAAATACIDAFVRSFESGGGVLLRAKWDLHRSPTDAVATYGGRKGLMAAAAIVSEKASEEQEGAIGSEIRFEIVGHDGDNCYCTMWLAQHGSRLGFVNDGRFFRPYMRSVETEFAKLAPSVRVIKV